MYLLPLGGYSIGVCLGSFHTRLAANCEHNHTTASTTPIPTKQQHPFSLHIPQNHDHKHRHDSSHKTTTPDFITHSAEPRRQAPPRQQSVQFHSDYACDTRDAFDILGGRGGPPVFFDAGPSSILRMFCPKRSVMCVSERFWWAGREREGMSNSWKFEQGWRRRTNKAK